MGRVIRLRGSVFSLMLACVLMSAGAMGCGPTISRDVRTSLAPTLTQGGVPSVTVHLVGVNPADKEVWDNYSMTAYWDASNPDKLREEKVASGVVKEFKFGEKEGTKHTLEAGDPIWKTWDANGVTLLYVLVDEPRRTQDRTGNMDPRRRSFTLDRVQKPKPICLEIDHQGLITKKCTD